MGKWAPPLANAISSYISYLNSSPVAVFTVISFLAGGWWHRACLMAVSLDYKKFVKTRKANISVQLIICDYLASLSINFDLSLSNRCFSLSIFINSLSSHAKVPTSGAGKSSFSGLYFLPPPWTWLRLFYMQIDFFFKYPFFLWFSFLFDFFLDFCWSPVTPCKCDKNTS